VTAALGMAIGAGYAEVAVITTGMILVVLFLFSLVESWIDRVNQIRNYRIICQFENETLHRYEELFAAHRLKFKRSRQVKSAATNIITGEWVVQGSEENHRQVIHELMRDPSVMEFEY
jgi:putative Mg2+ transporter-C (MgtC) family protein